MTRDTLLPELRAIEARLRSAEVQAAWRDRPAGERRRLVAERAELSLLIARLTTAELAALASALEEHDRGLKLGMAAVNRRLDALDRPASALNALSRVLGLLARVVLLAG